MRSGDIDFSKRRIVLHRNAVTVNKRTAVGTLKAGKNRPALAGFVVEELAKTCEGKELDELIWPSRSGTGATHGAAATASAARAPVGRGGVAGPAFAAVTGRQRPRARLPLMLTVIGALLVAPMRLPCFPCAVAADASQKWGGTRPAVSDHRSTRIGARSSRNICKKDMSRGSIARNAGEPCAVTRVHDGAGAQHHVEVSVAPAQHATAGDFLVDDRVPAKYYFARPHTTRAVLW